MQYNVHQKYRMILPQVLLHNFPKNSQTKSCNERVLMKKNYHNRLHTPKYTICFILSIWYAYHYMRNGLMELIEFEARKKVKVIDGVSVDSQHWKFFVYIFHDTS